MNNLLFEIKNKIEQYDKIVILRHIRPDGDAVGSSLGLRDILRNTYPNKKVMCFAKDFAESLNFIAKEDEEDIDFYKDALGIVVDTATKDRISNDNIDLLKEVIKIDHHPNVDPYGAINLDEVDISATCELIVKVYNAFKDEWVLSNEAAELLYMGIVTDSGRFRFDSTSSKTFMMASKLLENQIDLNAIYNSIALPEWKNSNISVKEEYEKKTPSTSVQNSTLEESKP